QRLFGLALRQLHARQPEIGQRGQGRILDAAAGLLQRRRRGVELTLLQLLAGQRQRRHLGVGRAAEFALDRARQRLHRFGFAALDRIGQRLVLDRRGDPLLLLAALVPLPAKDQRQPEGYATDDRGAVVAQPLANAFALFVFVEKFDSHAWSSRRRRRARDWFGDGSAAGSAAGRFRFAVGG